MSTLSYEEILQHPLVNEIELKFVQKIIEDNSLFLNTKVKADMIKDPLAKTMFKIVGKNIAMLGECKPLIHLRELVEDTSRMEVYGSLGYPCIVNEPIDIVSYFSKFTDALIKMATLESFMEREYIKDELYSIANEITSSLDDSFVSEKELMSKFSFKLDSLLYRAEGDVIAKTASEVSDDLVTYFRSSDVVEYAPSGVEVIDINSGGLPSPCLVSWGASAKAGKSSLLIETVLNNLKNGRTCAFFSIEMSVQDVMHRLIARYADMDYNKIAKKEYDKDEEAYLIDKAKEFREEFQDKFFIYFNKEGITTKSIEAYLNLLEKSGIKIQDAFIDYLQILESSTMPNASLPERMNAIPKELRILSQKCNLRIFCPCQLGSDAREVPIEKIHGGHLYYAKQLERECHVLLALHKEDSVTKIKYMLSRLPYEDTTYFFPKMNLNRMRFGGIEEWDDSYKGLYGKQEAKAGNVVPEWEQKGKLKDSMSKIDW